MYENHPLSSKANAGLELIKIVKFIRHTSTSNDLKQKNI